MPDTFPRNQPLTSAPLPAEVLHVDLVQGTCTVSIGGQVVDNVTWYGKTPVEGATVLCTDTGGRLVIGMTDPDLNHDHDSVYVNVAGDTMTGELILPGDPTTGLAAATVNWTRSKNENPMLSGPHGVHDSYQHVDTVAGSGVQVFDPCLHHSSTVPGITRVAIGCYSHIGAIGAYSRASLSLFMHLYGRWHDGHPFTWANNLRSVNARNTLVKGGPDYNYMSHMIEGFFVNRPEQRCSLGLGANIDAPYEGNAAAYVGYMRISCLVLPNGTLDAGDYPSWGAP